MLNKGNNLNKPHNSVITYILCYVLVLMHHNGKYIKTKRILGGFFKIEYLYINIKKTNKRFEKVYNNHHKRIYK